MSSSFVASWNYVLLSHTYDLLQGACQWQYSVTSFKLKEIMYDFEEEFRSYIAIQVLFLSKQNVKVETPLFQSPRDFLTCGLEAQNLNLD